MKPLPSRMQLFVKHYARGMPATESARLAGYSEAYAKHAGEKILTNPRVKAELDKIRAEVAEVTKFDAIQAMEELRQALFFSKETENATAFCRAVELRMKLAGLLVDRVDQRQVGGFKIQISGIDDPPASASALLASVVPDIFL